MANAFRDRIVELVRVKASDLVPHPQNWRTHPKRQREALKAMLADVGVADAVLARRGEDGRLHLVDGHLRTETLGSDEIPVLVLDVTEDEANKILLTLDPIAGMAGADAERVSALLKDIQTTDPSVQAVLDRVARSADVDVSHGVIAANVDDVTTLSEPDKLREKWQTALGQVWEVVGNAGAHRIACGSATDPATVSAAIGHGPLATMMWTDPPYGVAYVGKGKDALEIENDRLSNGALRSFLRDAFSAAQAHALSVGAAFYVAHPSGALSREFREAVEDVQWTFRQGLVWLKDSMVLGRSDYHYIHEPIMFGYLPGAQGRRGRGGDGWYGGDNAVSVFTIPRPKANALHPTMKPVELVNAMLLNSSRIGDRVYEPFSGSGTTMLACESQRRLCCAVELDPKYVAVALERMCLVGCSATVVDQVSA